MGEATKFLENFVNKRVNNAVTFLLKNEEGKPSSDDALKSQLKSYIGSIKNTDYNKVALWKAAVIDRYNLYIEPTKTVVQHVEHFETLRVKHAQRGIDYENGLAMAGVKQDSSNQTNAAGGLLDSSNPAEEKLPHPTKAITDTGRSYIEIEGIYYGYELDGSSKTNKLVNPNPETYEEMASRVNHFTLATPKKVDILETTKNILDFCENKGFSKADLARTLKSFVEHHIKHMMALLSIKSENLEILEIIINSVSYTEAKKAVKNAISKLSRAPKEPIKTVYNYYAGLLLEGALLESPTGDVEKLRERCFKQAFKEIKLFMPDNMRDEYEELKIKLKTVHDLDMDLEKLVDFVDQCEEKPEYIAKVPIGLAGKTIPMSIFHINRIAVGPDEDVTAEINVNDGTHSYRDPENVKKDRYNFRTNVKTPDRYSSAPTKAKQDKARPRLDTPAGYRQPSRSPSPGPSPSAPAMSSGQVSPQPGTGQSYVCTPTPSPEPARAYSPGPRSPSRERGRSNNSSRSSSKGKSRSRNASSSAERRSGPLYYRSSSGNNVLSLNKKRFMSKSPGGSFRSSRRYEDKKEKASSSCKMCGGRHKNEKCPVYKGMKPSSISCNKCGLNLFHNSSKCQHSNNRVDSSKTQSTKNL